MNRVSSTLQPVCHGVLLACLVLVACSAQAQTTFDTPNADPGAPIKNKPYIADKVSHSKRSLADGTITTQDAQVWEARDSNGRVLMEFKTTLPPTPHHPATEFVVDSLIDPGARTILTWNSLTKTAILHNIPSPAMRALAAAAITGKAPPPPPNNTTELLGHRMLHGLMTTGRRTQKTIAAGAMGNTTATDTEHVWWTDDDLHLVVLDTNRSPLRGEQTIELQDLKLVEPDAARFSLPDGYTIRKIGPANLGNAFAALGTQPAASRLAPLDLAHAPALSHEDAELKLKSSDPAEQSAAAAVLVNEALASDSIDHKDYIAYQLAGANVGLSEAQQLAETAVRGAEITTSTDHAGNPDRDEFNREIALARYWHTLGYIYFRTGETELGKQYIESAMELDPRAYYGAHLGRLFEDAGQTTEALKIYHEALDAPGSGHEKDHIRDKIQNLSDAVDAPPVTAQTLSGVSSPGDGTAFFDLIYSSASPDPRVLFVSGNDAIKPLAPAIGRSAAPTFSLPDKGPEVIVYRVEITCNPASKPACQLRPLSALQAEDTLPTSRIPPP
jgi:tetratricopeptide (TPR) repeat protein